MTQNGRPDTFMTRAEMAEALGKSKTTIRRWEESGKLKPLKNEHGVNLFRREDALKLNGGAPVRTIPKAREAIPNAATASSALAAEIFDRLNRGVDQVTIVTELRVHPDIVEGFALRWSRMASSLILSRGELAIAMEALGVDRVTDGRQFVAAIQRLEKQQQQQTCAACHESWAAFCRECVRNTVREAARAHPESVDGE